MLWGGRRGHVCLSGVISTVSVRFEEWPETLVFGNKPGDHGRRTTADDETTRRDFEGHGQEDHLVGSSRDHWRVCDRTMRRMRERYQEFGYDGLFDQRHRKRSILRVPMEQAERVLALYREMYFDLSVRHFHEKLREEHGIELSYTWVKQALQGAGLVARRKKRGSHRRRRPRRPMPGMLLHIDGSKHRWFS